MKCSHTNLGSLCVKLTKVRQLLVSTQQIISSIINDWTCRETFSSTMSLVAMSLGDRFSVSRRGGAGEVDG